MLVKDLQQFLSTFTDKLKGNAISTARIYVERDGYLEEIRRMEVQENPLIGQSGIRLVMKTMTEKKLHLDDKLMKDTQEGGKMFELTEEKRKQLLQYLWTRPYGEVASIIGMLASLTSSKNSAVKPTDNKDTITSKK